MRRVFKFISIVCLFVAVVVLNSTVCHAGVYENPDTGYCVRIEDDANLLSEAEESTLADTMFKVTHYGNVAFKSIDYNDTTTERYIKGYYREVFGASSGTVFLIDMDNRNIWIFSDGAIYKTVTKAYADTITDNVYKYASDAEYFDCVNEVFSQISALLAGQKVRQPMKYISNALLAVIAALLINYIILNSFAKLKSPTDEAILRRIERQFECTKPKVIFTGETRTYSPQSSGGGGSSGGSRSSGGGGGGSSGGGGGHSF